MREPEVSSENATLGKLRGTFSVIGAASLRLRVRDLRLSRREHLGQLDPHLSAAGLLLLQDRRLSSWQMVLRRST